MYFERQDEIFINAEEKLAEYNYEHGITCERCGERIPLHASAWELYNSYYCYDCFIEVATELCEVEVCE